MKLERVLNRNWSWLSEWTGNGLSTGRTEASIYIALSLLDQMGGVRDARHPAPTPHAPAVQRGSALPLSRQRRCCLRLQSMRQVVYCPRHELCPSEPLNQHSRVPDAQPWVSVTEEHPESARVSHRPPPLDAPPQAELDRRNCPAKSLLDIPGAARPWRGAGALATNKASRLPRQDLRQPC